MCKLLCQPLRKLERIVWLRQYKIDEALHLLRSIAVYRGGVEDTSYPPTQAVHGKIHKPGKYYMI